MTKTICDICGKEMSASKFVDAIEDMNFCVSSHGRIWDICLECRESLNRWMTIRKTESEENMETKEKCPICEYEFEDCQCRFGGTCHPDRSKRERVVVDHIYLLTDKQIEHLKKIQKSWSISYGDEEKNQILKELERRDNK